MKRVVVDESFWDVFPEAEIAIMYVDGIDNHDTDENKAERAELLKRATAESAKFTKEETFRDNPVVAQWREAYAKFPKRKGARASVEALLKRASQGHVFEPIEPLVDVYNSISLRYGVPVGIEDRDKIAGDMHLGKAKGGESFQPVGADKDDPGREGEILYYDDAGAVCRSLNWRDAQRTMLTSDSKNVVIVMEAINEEQIQRTHEAMDELKQLIEHYFGQTPSEPHYLTKENPIADVD